MLKILSRTKMSKWLNSPTKRGEFRYLITITSPAQSRYPSGIGYYPQRLQLCFEDTNDATHPEAPQRKDVERIIAYCRCCLEAGGNMLINCEAGISRSTASGLIYLYLQTGDAAAAWDLLIAQNPTAHPNALMVSLADDILQGGGMLSAGLR